jgi:hypothetical protein
MTPLLSRLRWLPVVLLLSACAAPMLLIPGQRELMWALLTPLVGFDPNKVNLFEQPLIKQRMTSLLGSHYDDTMRLLHTANELQKEGPLFFVVSRAAPELAQQAGLVWNSDTDRLAAVLKRGDQTEILSEAVQGAVTATAPTWPAEITAWLPPTP